MPSNRPIPLVAYYLLSDRRNHPLKSTIVGREHAPDASRPSPQHHVFHCLRHIEITQYRLRHAIHQIQFAHGAQAF